jgi:GT2 family glycosyltransferase
VPCDLTIVLCSRNRRDEIEITLAALAEQVWDGAWDVLVVDNGSDDGTDALVESLISGFPVALRLVVEETPGLAHARNRAIREVEGRATVFLDDDATALPGLVKVHGEAFRDDTVIGTGGRILPVLPEGTPDWLIEALPTEIGGPTSRYEFGPDPAEVVVPGKIPYPFGANMGVRTEAARSLDGFRTELGWGKRMVPDEEVEFYGRLAALPGKILYLPDAAVEHRIAANRTSREYYEQWHQGLGRAWALRQMPMSLPARAGKLLANALKLWKWSIRARRKGDLVTELKAVRTREITRGRCLELMGH